VGVPVVTTLQGEEAFIDGLPESYRGEAMHWLRRHAASIDRFVCCGSQQAMAMATWLDVSAGRFAVISTGLDHKMFALDPGRVRGSTGPVVLGYLSSIRREKGLDLLVESLGQLVRTHGRDVRLAVAGQISDRAFWRTIRRTIRDAGLKRSVTYYGVPDLAGKVKFLRGCDYFVMPTRLAESRALAAMEALAAGVPVIASRLGVLLELLERTSGGVTVMPEDAGALTRGILELLDNADLSGAYARNGPIGIERHYSPQAMGQRTVEEYQRVLNGGTT
jgi:glycosyltransferase involved in cell wall biosynthesis